MGRVNVVVRFPKLHAKAWLGGWKDEASAIEEYGLSGALQSYVYLEDFQ